MVSKNRTTRLSSRRAALRSGPPGRFLGPRRWLRLAPGRSPAGHQRAAAAGGGGPPAATPAASTSAPLPRAAEPRDVYRPPADGRVTVAQVEMFLSVLDRERLDLRGETPTPSSDPLSSVPADVAAARARSVNVEEFQIGRAAFKERE